MAANNSNRTIEASAAPHPVGGEGQPISLAEVLEQGTGRVPQQTPPLMPGEVVIGILKGLDSTGSPLVSLARAVDSEPRPALSTVKVSDSDIGRQLVLAFRDGDLNQPVILGLLCHGGTEPEPNASSVVGLSGQHVVVDGETMRVEAKQRIELRCGKASITLTADGNVLIRGAYVLTRASGTNRIRGGNVQIN